jgi:uncharacterized membrane protein YukC
MYRDFRNMIETHKTFTDTQMTQEMHNSHNNIQRYFASGSLRIVLVCKFWFVLYYLYLPQERELLF